MTSSSPDHLLKSLPLTQELRGEILNTLTLGSTVNFGGPAQIIAVLLVSPSRETFFLPSFEDEDFASLSPVPPRGGRPVYCLLQHLGGTSLLPGTASGSGESQVS